ncbi:hypothetical protein F1C58_02020 [Glaciihabitans sp. INWT7]|uniref:hypothetical protein n=1 Tax=Glaciihabitans sp. INWT7 TaxID=2596912 RepID=UPI001628695C|nr:hypothetical protein [Glaciihabitans sp. INWT7]QNE45805.1 hypothetical protein F1C58_02020 [Glaciihabitans sp. INWT7]
MPVANDRNGDVWLRPRRSLLRSGILIFIIVPIPIVATLITLGLPSGSWRVSAITEALVIVLFFVGLYLLRTTYVVISADHFTERGFFRRPVVTPISEVSSMVLAQTFSSSSSETLPQLILRNARGERILRMRGIFWTEESMRQAAAAIGTPLEEPAEPLTPKQFFELYSGTAYWFENRRGLAIAVIVLIGLVCVGIVLGLMVLLGLPFVA